jgi:hypothetical protein
VLRQSLMQRKRLLDLLIGRRPLALGISRAALLEELAQMSDGAGSLHRLALGLGTLAVLVPQPGEEII